MTLVLISLFCFVSLSLAWVPVDSISAERLWFREGGDSLALAYYSSHDLNQTHPNITRAVINLHGASRESEEAAWRVFNAGNEHDRDVFGHTAIIAPQFLFTTDIDSHDVTDSLLYWNTLAEIGPSWCYGRHSNDNSNFPRPFRIDSYTCLDTLGQLIIQAFPNVENIVYAGHSAGGRMIERYPMVTQWDLDFDEPRILYNPANPAVYAYTGPERHVGDNWDEFAIPSASQIADCPEYNHWPFGLDEPYDYFVDLPENELHANFTSRHFILWISENDTLPMEGGSQDNCMAMMMGELHRKQRGMIFWNFLDFKYDGIPDNFVWALVPNLGHFGAAVLESAVGRYYLFDHYHPLEPGETIDITGNLAVPTPYTVDGIIDYAVTVENESDETRTGDVWMVLVSSINGTSHRGWTREMVYEPDMDFSRPNMEFYVPNGFPHGQATLYFNVGTYPDVIVAWDAALVTVNSTTSVGGDINGVLAKDPTLIRIAPNPFNASTSVVMDVPRPMSLNLRLFDILGRDVLTVFNGPVGPGQYTYSINGNRLAGGVYFLEASTPGGYQDVRKVMLLP